MANRQTLADLFASLFPETEELLEDYERLPGLHRSWELEQVLRPGRSYVVRDAGKTAEGAPLFTIYRERGTTEARS